MFGLYEVFYSANGYRSATRIEANSIEDAKIATMMYFPVREITSVLTIRKPTRPAQS